MRIGGWWVLVGDELGREGRNQNPGGRKAGWMDDGGRMDVLMLPTKLYMLL